MPSLHHATLSHNDIAGYYFGAITVLYGITLALFMVGGWSTFTETKEKVDREAGAIAALYLDVNHYPEPNRELLEEDLLNYTRQVIYGAWPQQRKGIVPNGNIATNAVLSYTSLPLKQARKARRR